MDTLVDTPHQRNHPCTITMEWHSFIRSISKKNKQNQSEKPISLFFFILFFLVFIAILPSNNTLNERTTKTETEELMNHTNNNVKKFNHSK